MLEHNFVENLYSEPYTDLKACTNGGPEFTPSPLKNANLVYAYLYLITLTLKTIC